MNGASSVGEPPPPPPPPPPTTSAPPPSSATMSADAAAIKGYLRKLVPAVFGVEDESASARQMAAEVALFDEAAGGVLQRFASSGDNNTLFIVYSPAATSIPATTTTNILASHTKQRPLLSVSVDVPEYSPSNNPQECIIALIKRNPPTVQIPVHSSLQLILLPASNPYQTLHSYIHNAVSPFFDAFVAHKSSSSVSNDQQEGGSSGSGTDKDAKTGIPMAKKKMAELELSLLHLQQNVEIPEISLYINPTVQKIIDQCREQGKRVIVEYARDLINDSSFLNRLQSDVNDWIKEIQKVTKLDRDPASGTASQEINFWISMEKVLFKIEEQLKSEQIVFTLDILKTAKRFHATVSFLADTGLKEAMEKVIRYNLLFKDFPLNELLASTDVDKIRTACILIFTHVNKKLKLSPYPVRRALPLVEAISRDLNDQLLKVFNGRQLMYMDYADFAVATESCEQVFFTWDEQLKEFTHIARDVTRKRSEKFIPIKINNAHAALRERISFVRNFRKQHEQLHLTIIKVMKAEQRADGIKAAAAAAAGSASLTLPPTSTSTTSTTLSDVNAALDVSAAYDSVKNVQVLDVSPEGTELWVAAERAYNDKVSRVENQIIARLRDRLGSAKNANEMFRVFSKFNALFIRPKIRGAVQEYQTQLIDNVKEDIRSLHEKFKVLYRNSQASHMSHARDLPPISGAIIWAKQIERQLGMYMNRVEDVLGKGWELFAEGQKLSSESASFLKKLDTRPIFDAWMAEITKRDLSVSGRVFEIKLNRAKGNILHLAVNFDTQIIALFKEVRNLLWLNYQIPHVITNVAKDAKRVYPYAVSLTETIRTYNQTTELIAQNSSIASLLAGYRNDVQAHIAKGIQIRWEYFVNAYDARSSMLPSGGGVVVDTLSASAAGIRESRHVLYVREFVACVSLLHDKVNTALSINDEINMSIDELKRSPFENGRFAAILERIQKAIDKLNLEFFSNLADWTALINDRVEKVLVSRLQTAIKVWIDEFLLTQDPDQLILQSASVSSSNNTDLPSKQRKLRSKRSTMLLKEPASGSSAKSPAGKSTMLTFVSDATNLDDAQGDFKPVIQLLVHEIRMKNQTMFIDPPIEEARVRWYSMFQEWIANACTLKKIQAARYEMGINVSSSSSSSGHPEVLTYTSLLSAVADTSLKNAYHAIESKLLEVSKYVSVWLQYQSLWDMDTEYVLSSLGDDLEKWQQMVADIKKSRSTFDNSESSTSFGKLIVDYEQVQSKVNSKYDQWQREVLNKFGIKIGTAVREMYVAVSKARTDLEQSGISANGSSSSTSETVGFILFMQNIKKKIPGWTKDLEMFKSGQKTLEKNRYRFPEDWMDVDNLEGEWGAFAAILGKKSQIIENQTSSLQAKIIAEDKVIDQKIRDLVIEWEKIKPVQGRIKPTVAINSLAIFEGQVNRLSAEHDHICNAKEALDLDMKHDSRLKPIDEEVKDLKGVWNALSNVWSSLQEIKEGLWSSVVPRKIRSSLDELVASLKELPTRMRQYEAYEYIQEELKAFIKLNLLVTDLKSESLRDRHWRQIFKLLKLEGRVTMSELTLGHLWDADLKKNEPGLRDVIVIAQGEMALEEYLRQVKEFWSGYNVELVNYQNKCRLIRGWDDLFAKCAENLNSITAMKHSPYYKVFEEDASSWEDRLNRIHMLFDVWIDVQRQWVYLEGIFTGSADIKNLLPTETTRFQNINTEFMSVMKKVYKSPLVLDVLNIPNIQKSLERLAEYLAKIQKALGEYLEKERSSFPRFYFVGDEDLLDIIGNAKDVTRIQKHFKKMFAGVNNIVLSEDAGLITALSSREGEVLPLKRAVSIKENPRINDWLTLLESEMKLTMADCLAEAVQNLTKVYASAEKLVGLEFLDWIEMYPSQLVILSIQIAWTRSVEASLVASVGSPSSGKSASSLEQSLALVEASLKVLADTVLTDLPPIRRKKCEHLITELVHQRDVIRILISSKVTSLDDFAWLYHMRFYFDAAKTDPIHRLAIKMANASFAYGFEYLGVTDKLVQTPLTDRCYLTLTQALNSKLGGSPFGPAGTGKTESVKALGVQLGRFVLVFCCDENFDFQAMGRIFIGLCRVGAWGCFDEFNRLEERILSAVSQQIQTIQLGLKNGNEIEVVKKNLKVNPSTGVFITMNPGYAGRSNLPDNLKKLFRSVAMTKPDRELIAQVMLYSQGFRTAELLASKVVPLFNLCSEQLSDQSHYDFGLRSLKSVLVSAGNLKRSRLQVLRSENTDDESLNLSRLEEISKAIAEQELLIQSIRETLVPKLVGDDIPLLQSLMADVFPGVQYAPYDLVELKNNVQKVAAERRLVSGDLWLDKVIQLYQIQNIHHGVMMVGPSGAGKSSSWRVLLAALERVDGVEGVPYVIDPKAVSKEALYGQMDPTTREWTDGLFTSILRKIIDNVRGESCKRHWIIFDGDVDPEWVENLNSVLDDNKLLTLPNGERLSLPPNVRIMFEVETLKYATLATVSRCGMVWFSDDVVHLGMICTNYLKTLQAVCLDDSDDQAVFDIGASQQASASTTSTTSTLSSPLLHTQDQIAEILKPHLELDGVISKSLEYAETSMEHIMDFTRMRALSTFFSLLNKTVRNVLEYNLAHPDFPMNAEHLDRYVMKRLALCIVWSFGGDAKLDLRAKFGEYLSRLLSIELPNGSLIDYDVNISNGEWFAWQSKVPVMEIASSSVTASDIVISTVDTIRHEEVLYSWLSEHKPLILCGPPGSGKTMTLFSALRKLPDMEVVDLNFSSATTPELVMRTLEQYCEYRKTPNGVILSPVMVGRWLVLFCDEINLPSMDKYGTQRIISFLRQLIEHGGYWRSVDKLWVKLERIQFVGACNPPTDPGRVALSHRFLRHAPLIMVDYPAEISLKQIYGTFNKAMLKLAPSLRGFADSLTDAMVEFYLASQKRFTPDIQAHYIYSPRELTRWVRGIYEVLCQDDLPPSSLEDLVRIWAHEALRLFQDRLVTDEERKWTDDMIDHVAVKHFPGVDQVAALTRPILFSDWLSKIYAPVNQEKLRELVRGRSRSFYEEELDTPLVLFNDVLEHCLRINRVFRQVQGHLLLIGISGSGKTTLSRFVAWMKGMSIFQIKVHNKYTSEDFDDDLRGVLKRAGCKSEKICFIMDESNVLDTGFLERMNTLLANGEVPGLFEGDEKMALMNQCKEAMQRENVSASSNEEIYKWFTKQVMRNLHVVFTMNPPEGGLASKAATSPALFNRCVLDWFGDWSDQAFYQVGKEFTDLLDLDNNSYQPPVGFPVVYNDLSDPPTYRDAILNSFVFVHKSLYDVNAKVCKRQGRTNYVTPRHYLDFISHYVKLFNEKRDDLEERQRHLNIGVQKLQDTVVTVEDMRKSLAIKRAELEAKNTEANEKLKKMVADQQEAEKKKSASVELQKAIDKQTVQIEERRKIVMEDLSKAEPAVIEAQQSVSSIKKQHLTEVRSMGNPPEAVKMAMESVCILLGHKVDSWKTVQTVLRRDDFISSIVNYDTDKLIESIRRKINDDFLVNPNYNFESVNRASKACGPLVQWVIAQVSYAEILERVGPLRQEVQDLEVSAESTKKQASEIQTMIQELEESISQYKDEYAVLISESQALKSEMEKVKTRVDRSVALLANLSSESVRWDEGIKSFSSQIGTIVGDVLLSAAYMSYGGYFDQQYRETLFSSWSSHLARSGVLFRPDISLMDYLSTPDERLTWQGNSLPTDTLCTENAIMIKRFNRFPLIIDPSGQAIQFLRNEYKDRRIVVTSFLDDSFLKVLETALRFGNPLIIQDVEKLDPILNPVLNKELRRTGGRVLIRLGSQDIDYSPSFTMFLVTRDPTANFAPDICSRVTFINFTVTRGSLQSQCLHQVLKVERPDVDKKRTDLIKLQGEFQLKLRHLEKSLLKALNESEGNILEDDKIIDTLETLKMEASDISQKVEETDVIMKEVDSVTSTYTPLAQFCSTIFFVLEQISVLNHFYQFSLEFFMEIFQFILHDNPNLVNVKDAAQRLNILSRDLFQVTFNRSSQSLLHDDHALLAIILGQVRLRGGTDEVDDREYEAFLSGLQGHMKISHSDIAPQLEAAFGEDITKRVLELSLLPSFKNLAKTMLSSKDQWLLYINESTPELVVSPFEAESPSSKSSVLKRFHRLLIIKCLRPDRLLSTVTGFIDAVFGPSFIDHSELNLNQLVLEQVSSKTPISMCSIPGYDASYRVEHLAAETNSKLTSVAMGSAEGFSLAEAAIKTCSRAGSWVLLKNVHLAPSWLIQLEKLIYSLKPHANFRLFLTMETNPKVPVNVIRMSRVLMFEPPPGIKANLHETLSSIAPVRVAKGPNERARLYFLLGWLHSVVQERLRYSPIGWTKMYEFNDSDHEMALSTIDAWLDTAASGRSNISPSKIPWDAIRILIKDTIYGGKIDSEFDQKILDSFVNALFTPLSYETEFNLVAKREDGDKLSIPDGTKLPQFLGWVKQLPDQEPPHWLGLPGNAERVLMEAKGHSLVSRIKKLQSMSLEDELADDSLSSNDTKSQQDKLSDGTPTWMRALSASASEWIALLPESISDLKSYGESTDPITRFFIREIKVAKGLLKKVRRDLSELIAVCSGDKKQTNHLRMLISCLTKATVPSHWLVFKVPHGVSVNQWMMDLKARFDQIERISSLTSLGNLGDVWLGGLFNPEAFITASRQAVAQKNGWSLEELSLSFEIGSVNRSGDDLFAVSGLRLEGAAWVEGAGGLKVSTTPNFKLEKTVISWKRISSSKHVSSSSSESTVDLPVYLNKDRGDLLFIASLSSVKSTLPYSVVVQRGVAITAASF